MRGGCAELEQQRAAQALGHAADGHRRVERAVAAREARGAERDPVRRLGGKRAGARERLDERAAAHRMTAFVVGCDVRAAGELGMTMLREIAPELVEQQCCLELDT